MALTLDELKFIEKTLIDNNDDYSDINEALKLIKKEIKLKTTDFVRMVDAQGNPIENDGH